MAVKEKEQNDKQTSRITTLKTAPTSPPRYTRYSQIPDFLIAPPNL